jgi:hypothetical protein
LGRRFQQPQQQRIATLRDLVVVASLIAHAGEDSMVRPPESTLQRDRQFNLMLGMFYSAWTSTDMTIDYAIGRFLEISRKQTHVLTSGMMYGTKIRLLKELVKDSDHENKAEITYALNSLQNESKRNVFAHSYIVGDPNSITFVERTSGGPYSVRTHKFTLIQWNSHVTHFVTISKRLWDALEISPEALEAFALAMVRSSKS